MKKIPRYIDADALNETVDKINDTDYGSIFDYTAHREVRNVLRDIKRLIDSTPTIEAEPVRHGELISTGFDEIYCEWGNCSNCGADNMMSSKRCCECGTRFDGRDDKK